jgi:hypothetical protein
MIGSGVTATHHIFRDPRWGQETYGEAHFSRRKWALPTSGDCKVTIRRASPPVQPRTLSNRTGEDARTSK